MSDASIRRQKFQEYRMKFIRVIFFTLFLIYPSVSTSVIGYFNCRGVEGKSYLIADFGMECGSDIWKKWLPYLTVMLFVYPIGIPLITFLALWRHRHRLREPNTVFALGFMYEAYQLRYWWFEQIDMVYKLLMTAVLVQIAPPIRLQLGLFFVGIYTCLVLIIQPFLRRSDDWFHMLVQTLIVLMLLSAHTFQAEGEVDESMDIVVSVFLITLTVILCILLVAAIVRVGRVKYLSHVNTKRQREQARVEDGSQAEVDGESPGPADSAHSPPMTRNSSLVSLSDLASNGSNPDLDSRSGPGELGDITQEIELSNFDPNEGR